MRRYGPLILALLCTCALTSAEPFKLPTPNVGDWIEFSSTSATSPTAPETTSHLRYSVTAVDPSQITIQIANLDPGKDSTFLSATITLDKPHGVFAEIAGATPLAHGEEELTIGSRKLRCKWTRYEKNTAASVQQTYTLYSHPDIPIHGLAKVEIHSADGSQSTIKITAFERAKPAEKKQP